MAAQHNFLEIVLQKFLNMVWQRKKGAADWWREGGDFQVVHFLWGEFARDIDLRILADKHDQSGQSIGNRKGAYQKGWRVYIANSTACMSNIEAQAPLI